MRTHRELVARRKPMLIHPGSALAPSHLVTRAVQDAGLGAERGGGVHSTPAREALTLGGSCVAAPLAPAGSRAHGERVGGVVSQEIVIGVAEQVKQHLRKSEDR